MTSTEYKAKIPAGAAAVAGLLWSPVPGSMAVPVGRRPRGSVGCRTACLAVGLVLQEQDKEGLAFGAQEERAADELEEETTSQEENVILQACRALRCAVPGEQR